MCWIQSEISSILLLPYTGIEEGGGSPPVSLQDIVKVMPMQAYFGMPNRVAHGFLRLFGDKLGISSEFSYKTIERGYDPEKTKKILVKCFTHLWTKYEINYDPCCSFAL
jgi:transposase